MTAAVSRLRWSVWHRSKAWQRPCRTGAALDKVSTGRRQALHGPGDLCFGRAHMMQGHRVGAGMTVPGSRREMTAKAPQSDPNPALLTRHKDRVAAICFPRRRAFSAPTQCAAPRIFRARCAPKPSLQHDHASHRNQQRPFGAFFAFGRRADGGRGNLRIAATSSQFRPIARRKRTGSCNMLPSAPRSFQPPPSARRRGLLPPHPADPRSGAHAPGA